MEDEGASPTVSEGAAGVTEGAEGAKDCHTSVTGDLGVAVVTQGDGAEERAAHLRAMGISARPRPPALECEQLVSMRRIDLGGGSSLALTVSIDAFSISPADRTFVFDLIDAMVEHEKGGRRP